MNVYFLVEGKTEKKIYPRWLEQLLPTLTRIQVASDVQENNYYLISGGGYPQLLETHLPNAIDEINESGQYDYFVISLDADEVTVEERIREVEQKISEKKLQLRNCQLQIIVQNRCIETWFMGNRKVFPRNPTGQFTPFFRFYDVSKDDPEQMGKTKEAMGTIAQFHKIYLKKMLAEKNINYSETIPHAVGESDYLEQLQERVKICPSHLKTLQCFFSFCGEVGEHSK